MSGFNRILKPDTALRPQNDVYSDKVLRCNGDEASLEDCGMDPEFSGVCHHVTLSCYNPSERPKCPPPPSWHLFDTDILNLIYRSTLTNRSVRACRQSRKYREV